MNRSIIKSVLASRGFRHVVPLAAMIVLCAPDLAAAAGDGCRLKSTRGDIQRVIYIQFDNTHLRRDNPNVPSDLEQMPHLRQFIEDNGTLLANDHTILISHTAGGILSTITGVYPDRHGQTVSNSYVRTSSAGGFTFPSSFGYWTDSVSAANTPTVPNMITPDGKIAPAPWVVFTRAGCDVGAIGMANMVLENTGTGPTGDITKVFGNPSPQFSEAQASAAAPAGSAARARAQTDFVGLAIHCAQGSPTCATGHADTLPDEPGGYSGFKGLFGAQEINPALTGGSTLTDLLGNGILDPFGQPGFPGFDGMLAAVSLSYIVEMQKKGVRVTFAYISDAHDFHGVAGNQHVAFGPGSQGYVDQLKAYDDAFAVFFARLKAAGITRDNTLFVFTVDEGDHFAGVRKTDCDGVNTPCVYGANEVGEINTNIDTLVAEQFPALASQFLGALAPNAFTVHGDSAPTFYLAKKGAGPLAQTDALTRDFERSIANLTAVNPYTGNTDRLRVRMADQTGMKAMHMFAAADPARNPVFVLFANPDYFITDFPSSTCKTCINPLFAWNHGDIQREIAQTWIGLVGPGVRRTRESDNDKDRRGDDRDDRPSDNVWTDHADVRPTMLTLVGLRDSYVHDGRAIVEPLFDWALPQTLRAHSETLLRLGQIYKQVNAPFGRFAMRVLDASTHALASGSVNDDSAYGSIESRIQSLTDQRDALALQMKTVLDAATFNHQPINEHQARKLIDQGNELLERAGRLSGH